MYFNPVTASNFALCRRRRRRGYRGRRRGIGGGGGVLEEGVLEGYRRRRGVYGEEEGKEGQ